MSNNAEKVKKPFYKKWWFWLIVVLFIFGAIGSCTGSEKTEPESDIKEVVVEEATATEIYSAEDICSILLVATSGDVGEDEHITDIALVSKQLVITVDLSSADPSPFTFEDLAESRAVSITDTVLEYIEFDYYWDTVLVDFGDTGYFEANKSMIMVNEYDMRYFDLPLEPTKK